MWTPRPRELCAVCPALLALCSRASSQGAAAVAAVIVAAVPAIAAAAALDVAAPFARGALDYTCGGHGGQGCGGNKGSRGRYRQKCCASAGSACADHGGPRPGCEGGGVPRSRTRRPERRLLLGRVVNNRRWYLLPAAVLDLSGGRLIAERCDNAAQQKLHTFIARNTRPCSVHVGGCWR